MTPTPWDALGTPKAYLEGVGFEMLLDQFWAMTPTGTATLPLAGWLFRHRTY